jgi:hypothetical protein
MWLSQTLHVPTAVIIPSPSTIPTVRGGNSSDASGSCVVADHERIKQLVASYREVVQVRGHGGGRGGGECYRAGGVQLGGRFGLGYSFPPLKRN